MTQRPFMPINWGEYRRETQGFSTLEHGAYLLLRAYYWDHGRLPETYVSCQNVTGLTRRTWPRVWLKLSTKFTPDGRQPKWDAEIERVEILKLKRRFSGEKGAAQRWQMPLPIAMPKTMANPMAIAGANLNKIDTSSILSREGPKMKINGHDTNPMPETLDLIKRQNREAGIVPLAPASLASALPSGALTRPANADAAKPNGKLPHELTRQEIDEMIAAKRANLPAPSPSDDEQGGIPFD